MSKNEYKVQIDSDRLVFCSSSKIRIPLLFFFYHFFSLSYYIFWSKLSAILSMLRLFRSEATNISFNSKSRHSNCNKFEYVLPYFSALFLSVLFSIFFLQLLAYLAFLSFALIVSNHFCRKSENDSLSFIY